MAFAGNVTLVTVTGNYVDFQGNAIAGQVIFYVPKTLRNALADQILVPSSYAATLDANGSLSVVLPATDDLDFHETFEYRVTESFPGGRTYSIVLPSSSTAWDLSDLAPVPSVVPHVGLAQGANATALEKRIAVEEADVIVSFGYSDIERDYATYQEVLDSFADYDSLLDSVPVVSGVLSTSLVYLMMAYGYATYQDVVDEVPSYDSLLTVMYPGMIRGAAVEAGLFRDAAVGSLEGALGLLDELPHPFVFVGSLGSRA